jgi:hypothetical protein
MMLRRNLVPALALVLVAISTAPAMAQKAGAGKDGKAPKAPAPAPAPAPDPVGGDSAPAEGLEPATEGDGDGGEEGDRPNDPDAMTTKSDDDDATAMAKVRPTKATYPIAVIERPLTLTRNQAEVTLDVPVVFDVGATQVLRGGFGVTQDIQVGVSYAVGLERFKTEGTQKGFEPGKALSIDGAYTVIPDHLAVTLSIPLYFSPFAASVSIGAPFRVRLHKKFALIGGNDLLAVAFNRWPVVVADPAYNLAQTAFDVPGQGSFDRGILNINAGAQVQYKPNLVFTGMFGIHFPDFSDSARPVSATVGATWTRGKNLDVGARLGMSDLSSSDTFGLAISAAYRL